MVITEEDKKRYILPIEKDIEILEKIKEAEKLPNLSSSEKSMLSFLRTQLEEDWRSPIIGWLDELIKIKSQ